MCAPLCDAVLNSKGSAAELEEIERANLFLVPLDHHRGWYRYHHLFRDLLQHELEEQEPDLVPVLHRRAADWYEAHRDPESALVPRPRGRRHRRRRTHPGLDRAAGPRQRPGRRSSRAGSTCSTSTSASTDIPTVAIQGSSILAARGRAEEADRWLHAAERGVASRRRGVGGRSAPDRGHAGRHVRRRPRADAGGRRRRGLEAHGPTTRGARRPCSSAAPRDMLLGDTDSADLALAEAVERAATTGSTETRAIALSERSMLAAAREDVRTADALAEEAQRVVEEGELADYPTSALALAASARAAQARPVGPSARRLLTAATRLTPHLTHALPWLAVQARIELARRLRDAARPRRRRTHPRGGARNPRRCARHLGVLDEAVARLEREIDAMPETRTGGGSGLTPAELRLLPLLSTHLSFREIGERLLVSRNTIKTQAISVYRKLGVSSRSEAIAVAEDLGLVEAAEQKNDRLEVGETVGSLAL